jgi:hypothetical protein
VNGYAYKKKDGRTVEGMGWCRRGFRAGKHFGAELGASLPVLGAERALAIGGLKLTYRM